MAGQDELDGARRHQQIILPAVGMHHRHDEVGAFAMEYFRLLLGGPDRRQEFQILGLDARGVRPGRRR